MAKRGAQGGAQAAARGSHVAGKQQHPAAMGSPHSNRHHQAAVKLHVHHQLVVSTIKPPSAPSARYQHSQATICNIARPHYQPPSHLALRHLANIRHAHSFNTHVQLTLLLLIVCHNTGPKRAIALLGFLGFLCHGITACLTLRPLQALCKLSTKEQAS